VSTVPVFDFTLQAALELSRGRLFRLCLPQIKPEHIGDAIRPGSDGTECAPLPQLHCDIGASLFNDK
jgi:hypothetical protein